MTIDGNRDLPRIAHTATTLTVTSRVSLASVMAADDSVVGVAPAYGGPVSGGLPGLDGAPGGGLRSGVDGVTVAFGYVG
ncbi:hypothetical protein [Actinoplanes sp. NPDC051851]|uniref:hypothetical protein n=1 Tax=Actinoplanes sp. NPDC051851 TaxID=3154753 RepID=UPI0034148469